MDDRVASLTLFRYEPHQWSVGDFLHLTLEFNDELAMRSRLRGTPLAQLADLKLGTSRLDDAYGPHVIAEVFGPTLMLSISAEERDDDLSAEHFEAARQVEALLRSLIRTTDLAARPLEWLDVYSGDVVVPQARTRPPRRLVALEEGAAGIEARVIRKLDARRGSDVVERLHVTNETVWAGGSAVQVRGLRQGALAFATLGVGLQHNGLAGAIAATLEPLTAPADVAARAGALVGAMHRARVPVELGSAADAVEAFLIAREEGSAGDFDQWAERTVERALHGSAPQLYRSLGEVLRALLVFMRDERLPCMFRPRAALERAVAACGRGVSFEQARDDLHTVAIVEGSRSLEVAGDARRFVRVELPRTGRATHVAATEGQLEILKIAGLLR